MNVKELIEELKKCDPELDVLLQKDPEGNGYENCMGADPNCIFDDGEVVSTEWTADEACMDEDEWEEFKKRDKCCVIYP